MYILLIQVYINNIRKIILNISIYAYVCIYTTASLPSKQKLYSISSFFLFDKMTLARNASATLDNNAGYTMGTGCFDAVDVGDGGGFGSI